MGEPRDRLRELVGFLRAELRRASALKELVLPPGAEPAGHHWDVMGSCEVDRFLHPGRGLSEVHADDDKLGRAEPNEVSVDPCATIILHGVIEDARVKQVAQEGSFASFERIEHQRFGVERVESDVTSQRRFDANPRHTLSEAREMPLAF